MGLRLGLLSTARINDAILAGAAASTEVEVVAVASREAERARTYARDKRIATAHGSYDALLADPDVDAVYISLPNRMHAEWAVRALEAGKHVLVEKPFSRHVAEVEQAFDVAEREGLVLTEGFMWRHHPQTHRLVELLSEIGEVRLVRAVFSFDLGRPGDPRWEPALDGGALMDVGCYCISAARLLCGEPEEARGTRLGKGVDTRFAGVLRFDGALATFDCGFDLPARSELEVIGTGGSLVLDDPWHARKPRIKVRVDGDRKQKVRVDKADSYRLQLDDLAAAVRGERPPLLGRDDAVGQARVLEALHA